MVLARTSVVTADDLRLPEAPSGDALNLSPGMTMKEVERLAVEQTLEASDGNVSATARTLGVSRRWLQYRLKEWNEDAVEAEAA